MRILGLALAVVLFAACGRGEPVSGPSVEPSGSPAASSTATTPPAASPSGSGGPSAGGTSGVTEGPEVVSPVPDVLVPADAGTFAMAVETSVSVRLDREHDWDEPIVEGDAVEITRTAFESDPGYDEYEVRARAAGTAAVIFDAPDTNAAFSFVVE